MHETEHHEIRAQESNLLNAAANHKILEKVSAVTHPSRSSDSICFIGSALQENSFTNGHSMVCQEDNCRTDCKDWWSVDQSSSLSSDTTIKSTKHSPP